MTSLPRWTLLLLVFGLLALAGAACGRAPGPRGWASPRPVTVGGQDLVLVAHKGKLYALPKGAGVPRWQFPPPDKNTYPVSDLNREDLFEGLDFPEADHDAIQERISALTVTGPSSGFLKDAVRASTAGDDQKDELVRRVDRVTSDEKQALSKLRAIYGDIGVSKDGATAFVPTFKGIVFALDTQTGRTRWWFDAGDSLVGGVAVDEERDIVYFGTKGKRVYALAGSDGERLWTFRADGEVWSTPTIDGDTIYATSLKGTLYALDREGGRKWTFTGADAGIGGRAVVANGTVYVGSFDNSLYAVSAADGKLKWSMSADNWFWATPLVDGATVYAASLDGSLYAVDAATGAARWDFDTGAPVRSAPVMAGGGIVVAARDGTVFKLDADSGELLDPATESNETIEADLVAADEDTVYAVPRRAVLLEIDVTGSPGIGGFPLP